MYMSLLYLNLREWCIYTKMLSMHCSLPRLQCENEEVSAMMRVLVGVEMLQCNRNPRHMEFSVPSLSTVCTSLFMFSFSSCCTDGNNRCQYDPWALRASLRLIMCQYLQNTVAALISMLWSELIGDFFDKIFFVENHSLTLKALWPFSAPISSYPLSSIHPSLLSFFTCSFTPPFSAHPLISTLPIFHHSMLPFSLSFFP